MASDMRWSTAATCPHDPPDSEYEFRELRRLGFVPANELSEFWILGVDDFVAVKAPRSHKIQWD